MRKLLEPAVGSVRAKQSLISPRANGGRNRSFSDWLPCCAMRRASMTGPTTRGRRGTPCGPHPSKGQALLPLPRPPPAVLLRDHHAQVAAGGQLLPELMREFALARAGQPVVAAVLPGHLPDALAGQGPLSRR